MAPEVHDILHNIVFMRYVKKDTIKITVHMSNEGTLCNELLADNNVHDIPSRHLVNIQH